MSRGLEPEASAADAAGVDAMPAPDERMTVQLDLERRASRARLQRRLAWALVAAVLVYLFLLWWY